MNLRPLHDRVIIKRLDQESKTASGIIIPDAAAEKPDQGEVLAVGPGKYAGQTVKVGSDELLVMREEDIMAVVQK
jgi:chaperonin GroES